MAKKKKAGGYVANVSLSNDKSGKTFQPGEIVQDGDFPKSVIDHWIKRGRLTPIEEGGE